MRKFLLFALLLTIGITSCKKDKSPESIDNEDPTTFAEVGSFDVGEVGAAEISAFDPLTKRLFVVKNENEDVAGKTPINQIEIIDFADPSNMKSIGMISMTPFGGAVNSVAVHDGKLAAAIQDKTKQANGKVVVFKTSDYSKIAEVTVGALPDMVTFSSDGKYIMSANEGEPSADYTNDPSGTISIIDVGNNYAVTTIDFSSMVGQKNALMQKGFRIFGPGLNFVKDIEPEYITISDNSKTAWVTLQENNGIAKIDIASKTITDIFPLGFKDYSLTGNEIDPSDKDSKMELAKWNVKGIYMPDAIAVLESSGIPYLFTANEGDAREYDLFKEAKRVKEINLDPTAFPTAALLQTEAQLGRLNITTTMGDANLDGRFEQLYSFGARSFSVWNGNTGAQVFDSKNELDVKCIAEKVYDDGRSDDKSVEPEGITIGTMGNKKVAFLGMERADAVAVYDVTIPAAPVFLKLLKCGDAPEGVLFIPAKNSPTKKSLLVVSSEGDGVLKVYSPKTI